ncbi:MAG TPA: hypothetical protein VEO00_00475 [Actinomycetota bacterium]|nr:hypothetical protein [Actinomycetota bacterium]
MTTERANPPLRRRLTALASLVVVLVAMLLLLAAPARAQCDPYSGNCPSTGAPTDPGTGVRDRDGLAFTGADVTLFVLTGLLAIGTGAALVRRHRPNPDDAS